MSHIPSLMAADDLHAVAMTFGTAMINDESSVSFYDKNPHQRMVYRAKNGLRIWTEDGELFEYEGKVEARMGRTYMVTINFKDGGPLDTFAADRIHAITPANISISVTRAALLSQAANRVYH